MKRSGRVPLKKKLISFARMMEGRRPLRPGARRAPLQLGSYPVALLVLFSMDVFRAWALDPSAINDVLAQTLARQEQILAQQVASPYPSTGLWRYEDFALAAYWMNTDTATADAELIEIQNNGLYQSSVESGGYHWHAYLQARIYFLFSSQSDFFPGRMSLAAEEAVLEMLWDWASEKCRIGMFDPDTSYLSWGSENHDAQAWVSYWSAAHIFANHPVYSTYTYADGTTPAEMAAESDAYFKVYVRERALKGTTIEVASPTYAKYTLNTWLNLADFATDPELKSAASALLDIYWANWAMEQIDGVRGGSRHRSYSGSSSITGNGASQHCWFHFGIGAGSAHPGAMCAATTFWRPSRAVVGLALDTAGRGTYSNSSRRLGHRDSSPPPSPPSPDGWGYNPLDPEGGHLLRTTWCTPDFIMGMSQMDVLPADDWIAFSSQNRWNGVIFGGHSTARIFTQRPYPDPASVYNAEWGVQHKGAMILQHISQAKNSIGQMVWFDVSLNRQEYQGWILGEAQGAFAAVKIVDGGWNWIPDSHDLQRGKTATDIGEWAVLTNKYSPIILEVGRRQDYNGSLAKFALEIIGNPLTWDGTRLDYTSRGYDTTLTLFADESQLPQVDGVTIDLEPAATYDAPYLQGDFSGGPVIINYGDDRTIHGVAPFAADANTVAHWDFETMLPTIHPDSTNSIQQIADGKFGEAVRCSFEAGDQTMMTSTAWPTNQGTFRYQGWIRLNAGDAGGELFHVHDQISLRVDTAAVTFAINRSGVAVDASATNRITLSASISPSNDWQYIEAVYDGTSIQLVTETETVSAPGIGTFVPNQRNVYIGSRKNQINYVGDMDEVKVSSSITDPDFVPAPVVVAVSAQHHQKSDPDIDSNTSAGFAPATGPNTKLVVCASWESGDGVITNITYGAQRFTKAVSQTTGRHASIWYLDEPVAAVGDVVVQFSAPTDSRIGVLSLQNAAAGAPARMTSNISSTSISLSGLVADALAVGVYTENGNSLLSSDFANTLYSGDSGSSVGHAGYQVEPLPGTKTYSWNAATNSCAAVAAAFFPAGYIPPLVAGDLSDDDADGMADSWEIQHFGSMGVADGTNDADDDGLTDGQEFTTRTDPQDAGSLFEINGLSGGSNLTWKAVQGLSYRVLSRTNLTDGVWDEEASGIPGTPPESSYGISRTSEQLFLRIETE